MYGKLEVTVRKIGDDARPAADAFSTLLKTNDKTSRIEHVKPFASTDMPKLLAEALHVKYEIIDAE
jgi:hypothetical protein